MVEVVEKDGLRRIRQSARAIDDGSKAILAQIFASDELREYRCPNCDRLLFKGALASGSYVETKCRNGFCRKRDIKVRFSVA
jgi:hypothetical protein